MNALTPMLKPFGAPKGVDPLEWRKSVEARLNDLLDRAMSLITALDMMEVDPDLEETGDDEPSLGWTERGLAALTKDVPQDDREQDDSDAEDGHDDEPTLGWERGSVPYDQTHIISDAFFDECEDVSEDEAADINHQPQDGDELEEDSAEYDWGGGLIWGGNETEGRLKPDA